MIQNGIKELGDFFGKKKVIHYKKGETILRPGDTPQGVYFLNKGYVRLYSISESGEELTLIIFKPYDFFPMMWAINGAANENHLEAITDVQLYRSPREDFLRFLADNPYVFLDLTSLILIRMGGILRRLEYMAFGNAYQKVASILMICAERFGIKQSNGMLIDVPLTHKDLAMLVGMTRETVSIEIKKLEREGIVAYSKKQILVKDMRKLRYVSLLENE